MPACARWTPLLLASLLLPSYSFAAKSPSGSLAAPSAQVFRILSFVNDAAVQSDGRVLLDGRYQLNTGDQSEFLTRFNIDGTVDLAFTNQMNELLTDRRQKPGVYSVLALPDGKTLAAWTLRNENQDITYCDVVRLNADGTLDPAFSTRGAFGPSDFILSIHPYPNDRFIVAGRMNNRLQDRQNLIFRLNNDGSLDKSFNAALNINYDAAAHAVEVQPDGKIVVGMSFWKYSGAKNYRDVETLTRLNADGSLDAAFATAVSRFKHLGVFALALQIDRKIIVGGQALLTRLTPDGARDPSFFAAGAALKTTEPDSYNVHSVIIQPDGKILVGGDFLSFNDTPSAGLVRLNTDGTLDGTFSANLGGGFVTATHEPRGVLTVRLTPDGKILVLGTFEDFNHDGIPYIARLNPDGTRDRAFPQIAGTSLDR